MSLITYLITEITLQKLFLFLLLSGGPTLIWLVICLRLDRPAPEPKMQILKTFLWGALITIPLIFIGGYLTNIVGTIPYLSAVASIFILSFLVDGLIEESAKYVILRFKVYASIHFDELRDGFIYGMVLGLGLAFVENILYGVISVNIYEGASTVLLRGFTTTFLHFLSGGIIGYYLGLVKFSLHRSSKEKKYFLAIRGLVLAILLHGLYNTIVRFGWWWNMIPLAILLIGVYIIILRRIKQMV